MTSNLDRHVPHNLRKLKEIQNLSKAFTEQIPSTLAIFVTTRSFGTRMRAQFFQDSILDVVCFSLSRLARIYPKINAKCLDEKSYVEIENIDIGIAFDNGSNLKVLGIQDAAEKSLVEIQLRILQMLELYDSNQTIHPVDFKHTVTVTDLTSLDIAFVVPTLSSGQSMILSINGKCIDGFFITCTYDHRIMEGRYVSNFLSSLKAHVLEILLAECNPQNEISCSSCKRTLNEEVLLDPSSRGLIVLKNGENSEVLLCRVCFEGY